MIGSMVVVGRVRGLRSAMVICTKLGSQCGKTTQRQRRGDQQHDHYSEDASHAQNRITALLQQTLPVPGSSSSRGSGTARSTTNLSQCLSRSVIPARTGHPAARMHRRAAQVQTANRRAVVGKLRRRPHP
jgi:hypothetical protein